MRLYLAFVWLALGLTFSLCCAQSNFSLGSKYGAGISPQQRGSTYPTATQATFQLFNLHRGVIVQYHLNNAIGIETGVVLIHYGYSPKKQFPTKPIDDPSIDLLDFQVPFLLVLRKKHRFNVFRSYKMVAGTSVDMMASAVENNYTPALWLKNIVFGIRLCTEKLKHGRLEFGLEYQNSFGRFTLKTNDAKLGPVVLHSKLNLVALTLHYFMITKNLQRSPSPSE